VPLTASQLPRLKNCGATVSLPQYPSTSEWAERGTAIHHYIATGVITEGYEEELARIDLKSIPEGEHEVSFAWNMATGECRELGSGLGREYKLREGELAGTADIITENHDVIELKSGWKSVGPPAGNWQVMFAALCLSRIHELEEVGVTIGYLQEDGSFKPYSDVVDTFHLAAFESDLREALKGGPPNPGDWCRHCPSFTACPAKIGLIHELTASPTILPSRIDPENAAAAYEKLQTIKEALGHAEAQIRAYAAENVILLGDNRYFGPVEVVKEVIDADKAFDFMLKTNDKVVLGKGFRFETSKTAITKAFGKGAMDQLRGAGCVTEKTTTQVKEFRK
jgi:hypothetical protein